MDDLISTKVISSYEYNGLKIILETDGHSITDVLEAVDSAIRGHGYYPKGSLEYVEED